MVTLGVGLLLLVDAFRFILSVRIWCHLLLCPHTSILIRYWPAWESTSTCKQCQANSRKFEQKLFVPPLFQSVHYLTKGDSCFLCCPAQFNNLRRGRQELPLCDHFDNLFNHFHLLHWMWIDVVRQPETRPWCYVWVSEAMTPSKFRTEYPGLTKLNSWI